MTPEERAHWRQVVDSAQNEGLFTPPSTRDTDQHAGKSGRIELGNHGRDPTSGIVYVMGVNEPAILKLSPEMPHRATGYRVAPRSGAEPFTNGLPGLSWCGSERQRNYPSLIDIMTRIGPDTVRSTVNGGKGPMPSFSADIKEADMNNLLAYLANPAVASGQESGEGERARRLRSWRTGRRIRRITGRTSDGQSRRGVRVATARTAPMGGPPYPEGVEAPAERYYTGYNIMGNIIKPPYSTLDRLRSK